MVADTTFSITRNGWYNKNYVYHVKTKKMAKGKRVIIPGGSIRAGIFFSRFLPRKTIAKFLAKFQKKKVIEKAE